jgi:hypothetical protein
VELANLAGDTLDDVIAAAERGIQRIRHTHHLAFSFLRFCGGPYGEPTSMDSSSGSPERHCSSTS